MRRLLWPAIGAAAVVVRTLQSHSALLYPDGYQYLLMAHGIAAHGRPILELGRGGDTFVPSADAAAKPLYPTLVALVHLPGVQWLDAARGVSVAASAAAVLLCGLLALRVTRSPAAGALAAAACLGSPLLGYWAGFAGPDALAQALALGAALALVEEHATLGGILAGACVATRPEYGLVLVAGLVALAALPEWRPFAIRTAASAAFVVAAVLAAIRPPLALPGLGLVAAAVAAAAGAGALLWLSPRRALVAAAVVVAPALAFGGVPPALSGLGTFELLLAAAAVAGLAAARDRDEAAAVAVVLALLAGAYATKNASSARYLAQLVPLAAVAAALGVARLEPRLRVAAAGAAAAAAGAVLAFVPLPEATAPDHFGGVSRRLAALPSEPVVTAAPDAYGFLLYPRPVRALRRGARGLIVLDASERAYQPHARVSGRLVARITRSPAFLRPDGTIDRAGATVLRGRVLSG